MQISLPLPSQLYTAFPARSIVIKLLALLTSFCEKEKIIH